MEEFRKCATCGYERGFHVSFRKEGDAIQVHFICPECGSSFDLGLVEERIRNLKPQRGKSY